MNPHDADHSGLRTIALVGASVLGSLIFWSVLALTIDRYAAARGK